MISLKDIKITPLLDTLKLEKIDDEIYFSEKYNGYISNSRLSLINPKQKNDVQAFFEGLGKHNMFSSSLLLGSAVHQLVLQPELFYLSSINSKPSAKAGAMADYLYKQENRTDFDTIVQASNVIDYYKGKMNQEKADALVKKCIKYWQDRDNIIEDNEKIPIYIDAKMKVQVEECVNSLKSNNNIQNLLHPKGLLEDPISENEQAILLDVLVEVPDYEPFTLRLKAKLDNYTIDRESNTIVVNDVKTIGHMLSEIDTNISNYHYNREIAMYAYLLSLCAKKYYNLDNCKVQGNYLVVSTVPQYYSKVRAMTPKDFKEGFDEFKYLLRLVAYYITQGYKFE